jgi:hypothetical protein
MAEVGIDLGGATPQRLTSEGCPVSFSSDHL